MPPGFVLGVAMRQEEFASGRGLCYNRLSIVVHVFEKSGAAPLFLLSGVLLVAGGLVE